MQTFWFFSFSPSQSRETFPLKSESGQDDMIFVVLHPRMEWDFNLLSMMKNLFICGH